MPAKEENRIFVGGLSWDTTERRLEGGVQPLREGYRGSKRMVQYDVDQNGPIVVFPFVGHAGERYWPPRGFGFVTFSDPRAVDTSISEMHGHELDGRVISVNKAQPKMSTDDTAYGYNGGGYTSGSRAGYRGDDGPPPTGCSDECFKCGRLGHWARECPSTGGGSDGRFSSRSKFGRGGGRGNHGRGPDRYSDRYSNDQYDGGRDRYANDRYGPPRDRFLGDRYGGGPDHYLQNGYSRERSYERDGPHGGGTYDREGGPRGSGYDRDGPRGGGSDRYGSGGRARYDGGGSYRDRTGPYDRPSRGGHPPSFDVRY